MKLVMGIMRCRHHYTRQHSKLTSISYAINGIASNCYNVGTN